MTGFSAAIPGIPAIVGTANIPFNQNSRSGFLGGGQAGANWQAGAFVLGVQGDIAGLDVKGTDPCLVILTCTAKSDWLATVSGRVGAVIMDRGMIYAKGGGAWLHTNNSVALGSLTIAGVPVIPATNITSGSFDQGGWLVGLGTEWMITQNWTAFIEYDYMRFEDKKVSFPLNPVLVAPAVVNINTNQTNTLSIAKVGVNYKFGWGGGRGREVLIACLIAELKAPASAGAFSFITATMPALAAQLERWSAWPGLAVPIPTFASRWASSFANVGIEGPLANIDLQWNFGFDVRFGSARLGM